MYDKITDFNFLEEKNNIKIHSYSSCYKNCFPTNILKEDLKLIWLSEKEVPQNIIIDISKMIKKPKKNKFKFFGIHLWHAYQSNPKEIELYYSNDNKKYILIGIYELELRPGTHFFKIENKNYKSNNKVNFIKIIVTQTYGGIKTYINQIFLLDSLSDYDNNKFFKNFYFENTLSDENDNFQIYENKNKNKNYNLELKKKQKKFEKILKSDKRLKKQNSKSQNKIKEKNQFKKLKIKTKENDINSLSSHNNSSSIDNDNINELPIDKKNFISNQNFSFPSFLTNSNYKSNDSTNLTTIAKMKNSIDKNNLLNKDLMQENLENKLKEMKDYLKIIGAETNYNTFKNSTYSYFNNINFENHKSENYFNDNHLNDKVERIEKKINDIQNDIDDIKNVVLKLKKGINEISINENNNYNNNNIFNDNNFNLKDSKNNFDNSNNNNIYDINNKLYNSNNFYNSNNILYNTNNNSNNNEEIELNYINTNDNVLSEDESDKNINDKNYNMNINYNDYLKYSKNKTNNNNKNTKTYDSYLQNFDKKLTQKLNQLSNNIENQIYKNFIEPSLNQFNIKMKNSLDEMKKQIDTISNLKNKSNQKNVSSDSSINNNNIFLSSDSGKIKERNLNKNNSENESFTSNNEQILQMKYEQITDLSNKLYKKLCDKEKYLNEKADYLKGKLENNN